MAVAVLILVSLSSLHVLALKEVKGATAHTKEMNDALYGQLPFFDKTDFRNAHKGFIAPLPPAVIKGEKGAVIWNPQKYAFIKEGQLTIKCIIHLFRMGSGSLPFLLCQDRQ
ncbi:hypothetical protein A3N39_05565 [Enterobacter hormaechei subsp. steigerwaltii]|nr:hypothetical protein A3N39_05565 [Enterobacter hormaechei subsp. steigerwaltii]